MDLVDLYQITKTMNKFNTYTTRDYYKGIDDLKPLVPSYDEWGTYLSSEPEHLWKDPEFIRIRELENEAYVHETVMNGSYGEAYNFKLVLKHNPLFDEPRKFNPISSYRYEVLDLRDDVTGKKIAEYWKKTEDLTKKTYDSGKDYLDTNVDKIEETCGNCFHAGWFCEFGYAGWENNKCHYEDSQWKPKKDKR